MKKAELIDTMIEQEIPTASKIIEKWLFREMDDLTVKGLVNALKRGFDEVGKDLFK